MRFGSNYQSVGPVRRTLLLARDAVCACVPLAVAVGREAIVPPLCLDSTGLLWNAGETRVKCRNEFHRNADVIRPLVSQESFRRKRWRKEMCLTVHTGNQKSASTSWNRGQDSRGIEVLPFLRLSYDRRFPMFFLCLPREPKRA